MPPKKTTPKKVRAKQPQGSDERTKEVKIEALEDRSPLLKITRQQTDENLPVVSATAATPPEPAKASGAFQLNVEIPHGADEVIKKAGKAPAYAKQVQQTRPTAQPTKPVQMSSNTAATASKLSLPKPAPQQKLSTKIWNTLEWLATSALIFMVLFFIINFNAYSTLFVDRLNQLRGVVQTNPFVENLTHSAATATQQPLPIAATADQSKKQIPYLAMEVAPPDDRVIIPRINRNVPIVKISDANLIKRDWGALESQIQDALRDGVVHYPGTAWPGENGNVVITGHSSYFSWDPGRFKDVFALLHEVVIGDTVLVYHNQKKYFYQVYSTEVVTPDQVDVLTQNGDNRLTLITCTPVGTNLKRLVVFARPIPGNAES